MRTAQDNYAKICFMFRGMCWSVVLFITLLWLHNFASAQSGIHASITPPELEAFPKVVTFLRINDDQGKFIHGVKPNDIHVFEDGLSAFISEFQEVRLGVQLVIVLNPGKSFFIRDSKGLSRYDFLLESLAGWAMRRLGSSVDDLSIVVAGGPQRSHVSNPMELLYALEDFTFDEAYQPTLDSLSKAVDIAGDPPPRPGMERVVLYITPPLETSQLFGLQNLIDRAMGNNVRIVIWLVGSSDAITSQSGNAFVDLAAQTGGKFFSISTNESAPDIEEYLNPLRDAYYLTYESQVKDGGTHELMVEIKHNGESIKTPAQRYELNLQPPELAFLSPPIEITRIPTSGKSIKVDDLKKSGNLSPTEYSLQTLVDYPDGRIRPLVWSALFVDGVMVDENSTPPFDQFTWDLSTFIESGEHVLRVEAINNLGLKGVTADTIVQVQVENPSNSIFAMYPSKNYYPLVGGIAVFVILMTFLVMILGGKIRPRPSKYSEIPEKKPPTKLYTLTKLVHTKSEITKENHQDLLDGINLQKIEIVPSVCAYLTPISGLDQVENPNPIMIQEDILTVGKDSRLATLVLDDPSVEPLHARLIRQRSGCFRILDEGSIAGTWVNYTPVSSQGIDLIHGDLVHIGRVGFRFSQGESKNICESPVLAKDDWE